MDNFTIRLLCVTFYSYCVVGDIISTDINSLTKNFFDNLYGDPVLHGKEVLSDEIKHYVDRQVENYLQLSTKNGEKSHKTKRNLPMDFDEVSTHSKGVFKFSKISPFSIIPARFPKSLIIFKQNNFYAAVLESNTLENGYSAENLAIFKYETAGNTFQKLSEHPVLQGVHLSYYTMENSTIISVAGNYNADDKYTEGSPVFEFNNEEQLIRIQNTVKGNTSDVKIWKFNRELFMAVTQNNDQMNYIHIYKWLGKHFDVIQILETGLSKKTEPFKMRGRQYLAVAIYEDSKGNTNAFSSIYKYDSSTEKFKIYQRIKTKACVDIKYFNFKKNKKYYDDYLIVANLFDTDWEGQLHYSTDSVIYKFVEDRFIPFQNLKLKGAEQFLPIKGSDDRFILFAATKFDGLQAFYYDGWIFEPSNQQFSSESLQKGITSLQYILFNGEIVLGVSNSNSNGNVKNVFKLDFSLEKDDDKFYKEMKEWCMNTTNYVAQLENMKDNIELIDYKNNSTKEGNADKNEKNLRTKRQDNKLDQLKFTLASHDATLQSVENKLKKSFQSEEFHELNNNIATNTLILENDAFIRNLQTEEVNSIKVTNILKNLLDIQQGFQIQDLNLNFTQINSLNLPLNINNHSIEDIVYQTDLGIQNLVIKGSITVPEIEVIGKINNLKINKNNVLLKKDNQVFQSSDINIPKLVTNILETHVINSEDINNQNLSFKNYTPNKINNLNVKNLTVGDLINGLHVPTFEKYSLKKLGDQNITEEYYFNELRAENITLNKLNGKSINDIVQTKSGNWMLGQTVVFRNDMNFNNLRITERLNSIRVKNGKLDILLKNSSDIQYIPKLKVIKNLELTKLINLKGLVHGDSFQNINPIKHINRSIEKNETHKILNNVIIEKILRTSDVVSENGSLNKVLDLGLNLNEKSVPIKLNFSQQLNLNKIFVETINGINLKSWIVTGGAETQVITGNKVFKNNIKINGRTSVVKVNDINMKKLEEDIFKIYGDQEIIGNHQIKKIMAKSVFTNEANFEHRNWKNAIINNTEQTFFGATVIKSSIETSKSASQSINVKGFVNSINFTNMVGDTVTSKQHLPISSHKTIKNLQANHLKINNNITIKPVGENQNEIRINQNVTIKRPIHIKNINFQEKINGVENKDFYKDVNGELVIQDKKLKKITVGRGVFVKSNFINNLDLRQLENNTIKIDEDNDFGTVTFETVSSTKPIKLDGQVENLDFENLVRINQDEEQIITDSKNFRNKIIIGGRVKLNGLVNNMRYNEVCGFLSPDYQHFDKIIVNGNIIFTEGMNVAKINNYNQHKLKETIWFSDEEITLQENATFGDINFEKSLRVNADVNGINLEILDQTYFSKTRNQAIKSPMEFANHVVFKNNISAPSLNLQGKINGIDMSEFIHTALLNNVDQVFEDAVYVENCTVQKLEGQFTVNSLNLQNDVMLYDAESNLVTGKVEIGELIINNLNIRENVRVQDVDVLDLIKNAVSKDRSHNIKGKKTFTDLVEFNKHLSVKGKINDLSFNKNTIMLKNQPQNITALKTFIRDVESQPIIFTAVKLRGTINDMDLKTMEKIQAYKRSDNIFSSPINFHNNMTVENLYIKKTCQSVNVSDLIANITSMHALEKYEEVYDGLLDKAMKFRNILKSQPIYLDHFEVRAIFENVKDVIFLTINSDTEVIVTFENKNETNVAFYDWDNEKGSYVNKGRKFLWETTPTFITRIQINDKDYLYTENILNDVDSEGYTHNGIFLKIIDYQATYVQFIHSNGTKQIAQFLHPKTKNNCMVFICNNCSTVSILCFPNENEFVNLQDLYCPLAEKVAAVSIDNTPYIAVTNSFYLNSSVVIWMWNNKAEEFDINEVIFDEAPKSVDIIQYDSQVYLVIVSGHLQKSMHSGNIYIRRFNRKSKHFELWQTLDVEAPMEAKLALLPSNELVLYVLTANPTKPLLIFGYQGISGFKKITSASILSEVKSLHYFTNNANHHFLVTSSERESNVIEAIFKGIK